MQFRKTQEELGKADAFYLLFREHHLFFTSHNLQQSLSLYYFPSCVKHSLPPPAFPDFNHAYTKLSFLSGTLSTYFFEIPVSFFYFSDHIHFSFPQKNLINPSIFTTKNLCDHFFINLVSFLRLLFTFYPLICFSYSFFPSIYSCPCTIFSVSASLHSNIVHIMLHYIFFLFHRKNHSLPSLSLHEFQHTLLLAGFLLVAFFSNSNTLFPTPPQILLKSILFVLALSSLLHSHFLHSDIFPWNQNSQKKKQKNLFRSPALLCVLTPFHDTYGLSKAHTAYLSQGQAYHLQSVRRMHVKQSVLSLCHPQAPVSLFSDVVRRILLSHAVLSL